MRFFLLYLYMFLCIWGVVNEVARFLQIILKDNLYLLDVDFPSFRKNASSFCSPLDPFSLYAGPTKHSLYPAATLGLDFNHPNLPLNRLVSVPDGKCASQTACTRVHPLAKSRG